MGGDFAFVDKTGKTWSTSSLDNHPIQTTQASLSKGSFTFYEVPRAGAVDVLRNSSIGMVLDSSGKTSVWGFDSDEVLYSQSTAGAFKMKALWGRDDWKLLDVGLVQNTSNETFWAGQNLNHQKDELYLFEHFPLEQTSVFSSSLWGLDAKGRIWHNGQNSDISGMAQSGSMDSLILFDAQKGAKHLTRTFGQVYWISAEDTLYVQGYFMGESRTTVNAVTKLPGVKKFPNGILRDSSWIINSANQLQKVVFSKDSLGVISANLEPEFGLALNDGTGFVELFDNNSEMMALTNKGVIYKWKPTESDVPSKVQGGPFKHAHSSVSSECYIGADSTLWYSGRAGLDSSKTDSLIRKVRFGTWNSCYAAHASVIAENTDGTVWVFSYDGFPVNKSGGYLFPMPLNSAEGYHISYFQGNYNVTNTQITGSVDLFQSVEAPLGNPEPGAFSYWPLHTSYYGFRVDTDYSNPGGASRVLTLGGTEYFNGSNSLLRDLNYLDPSIHVKLKTTAWVSSSASGWGYAFSGLYYPFIGGTQEGFNFKAEDNWTFILSYPLGDTLTLQLEMLQSDEQQTYNSPPRYRYVGKGQKDTLSLTLSEFKREGWSATVEVDYTQAVGLKLYKLILANKQAEVFPSHVDTISQLGLWCFSTAGACEGDWKTPGESYDATKLKMDFSKIQSTGLSEDGSQLLVPDVDAQKSGSSQILNFSNDVFGFCVGSSNSFYDPNCTPTWNMDSIIINDTLKSLLQVRGSRFSSNTMYYEAYSGWWFMPKHNGDLSVDASKGAENIGITDSSVIEIVFKASANEVLALRLASDSLLNNLKTYDAGYSTPFVYQIDRFFLKGSGQWMKIKVPVSKILANPNSEKAEFISMIWFGRYVAEANGVLAYTPTFPSIQEKMPLEIACLGVGDGVCDDSGVLVNNQENPRSLQYLNPKNYNILGQQKNGTTVKFSPLKSYGEIKLNQ